MTRLLRATFVAFLITFGFGVISHSDDFTSIEGTYVLESRELADGTVLTPPAVAGLYTLSGGNMNLNRAVQDKDGKITSRSAIGSYKISGPMYTLELSYTAENDGSGVKYDFTKRSGSTQMVMTDISVEMKIPLTDNLYGAYSRDSFTAMSKGNYIDKWVRVK